ncbi:tail sheath stabilizer and completion protein [Escherichia coli]|nr:tail sheath stabilizer and completion protein [Escherichia coli]EJR1978927.1 tail sheath stabilizer and completion protein [Escherichia coli]
MKIDYYYDGQFRRVLKHLIRVFGEFQVQNGVDADGNPKYKKVPCRYADISRMAAAIINGNSENVLPSAPIMTISVNQLKLDRKSIRSNANETLVMGTNKSPAINEYKKELDTQYKIVRHNPVPWTFTFDLNIWVTQIQTKMELFEQISTLFAPSIQLQLSDNPLDWTSLSDVELVDCQFTTRGFPQGTDQDLDIMVLTFETTIWFSLPAIVEKPKLIHQITTNIKGARDEFDIEMGDYSDIITDVFTPKNLCIKVEEITNSLYNLPDTYQLTLVSQSLSDVSPNGGIYSWEKYLKYLEPNFDDKKVGIKFQQSIEEDNPLKGYISSYGENEDANKIIVQLDNSNYTVDYTIHGFVQKGSVLFDAIPEQYYVNNSIHNIIYKETEIPSNYMFKITNDGVELIDPSSVRNYIYNKEDNGYYRYNDKFKWHKSIMSVYRQGYWKITFTDK